MVKSEVFDLRKWLVKREFRIIKLSSFDLRACLLEKNVYYSVDFQAIGSCVDFSISRSIIENNIRKKTKDISLHGYSLDYIKTVITKELGNEA